MEIFKLPDLGEGLPDAEIVEWHVQEGDQVQLDQPMVSMETAKAVVDVPSPYTGKVVTLHGQAGDVIDTGAALVTFEVDGTEQAAPSADGDNSSVTSTASKTATKPETSLPAASADDSGTVVGKMETSDTVVREQVVQIGDFKATPAVRATARKLKVELNSIQGTGRGGVITLQDVKTAAKQGSATQGGGQTPAAKIAAAPAAPTLTAGPVHSSAPGEWTAVRGTRRTMARAMAQAQAQVVPTTITERADLALWEGKQDLTVRLIRAMVAGVKREPVLNSWFDADGPKIQTHAGVQLGIAVDTTDGLFVSNLRDADHKTPKQLRENLNQLRENVQNRSIPPADLTGYTIMLSNVGIYAGQYTTPVVTPPCVAIMAVGKLREEAVPAFGGIAVHPILPLSLTLDHRAVTGGEAARFLAAFCEDLSLAT